MNLEDAHQLLGVNAGSSELECKQAYDVLREKIETKLAKAPTSGLKEKYRASLRQVEEAYEILDSSADGGVLPVTTAPAFVPAPEGEPAVESAGPETMAAPAQGRRTYGSEITTLAVAVIIALFVGIWFLTGSSDEEVVTANLPALKAEMEETRQSLGELLRQADSSGKGLRAGFLKLVSIDNYVVTYEEHLDNAIRHRMAEEWSDARDEMKLAAEQHETFKGVLEEEWTIFNKK
jgi:hypothetical protein